MKNKNIVLSQSGIKTLFDCEMKYYYQFVRNLQKKKFVDYFLEGEIFQFGIYQLMLGISIKLATQKMLKLLESKIKDMREEGLIDTKIEQKLIEIKIILTGMLSAYAERYRNDLKLEKHVGNEVECIYQVIDGVDIGIQMDNIIEMKGKWFLHEGKAWKYLNENIVQNVPKNFQTTTYFYVHNNYAGNEIKVKNDRGKKVKIKSKPFSGILFDAVMKPSIRKGEKETYKDYLKRLDNYYTGAEANNKFFREIFDKPLIPLESWQRTIHAAAKRALRIHHNPGEYKENIVCSFADCGWCDYYELCIEGETKSNLSMYKISDYSKRYKK